MTINTDIDYEGYEAFNGSLSEDAEDILWNAAITSFECEDNPYECEVNILLTDDEKIHEINKENRNIDRSTDVLSFPLIDYESPADFDGFDDRPELFNAETGELLLGDIVISIDHVKKQAEEYGHSLERELAFLCVHSCLHLMGYDHMVDDERIIMEEHQRNILAEAGYYR